MLHKIIPLLIFISLNLTTYGQIKHIKVKKSEETLPSFNHIFFSQDAMYPQKIVKDKWVDKVFENLYVYTSPNFSIHLNTNYFIDKKIAKSYASSTNMLSRTENMEENVDIGLSIKVQDTDTFLFKNLKLQYLSIPFLYELNDIQNKFKVLDYSPSLYLKNNFKLSIPSQVLLNSLEENSFELLMIEIDKDSFYKIQEIEVKQMRNGNILQERKFKNTKLSFQSFEIMAGDTFTIQALQIDEVDNQKKTIHKNIEIKNNTIEFEVIEFNNKR